jgi:probable F420-dependent oxidoreductase
VIPTVKLGLLTPVLSLSPGKHAAWELDGTIDDVVTIAQTAERLGYHYLTCSEHVAIPEDRKGGFGNGHFPGARYWDPLPTFGFLAGKTHQIRFTTLVVVLSYHHPLEVAKRYGTLDQICGGRLNLGLGVGYLKPEFEMLGAPFADRDARADDAIRAIRASFGKLMPEYRGPFFKYSAVVIDPCGVQQRIAIWIGGKSRRSLRRAMELGDVWCPFSISTAEMRAWIAEAANSPLWSERPRPLDVAASTIFDPLGSPDDTIAAMTDWGGAGATMLTLRFKHDSLNHYLEQLEAMVELASQHGFTQSKATGR